VLKTKGSEKPYKKIMVGSRNNGHYCPNSRENSLGLSASRWKEIG